MILRSTERALVAASLLALQACVPKLSDTVRTLHSEEEHCPAEQITVLELGYVVHAVSASEAVVGGGYALRADGCGVTTDYLCTSVGCARNEPLAAPRPPPPGVVPTVVVADVHSRLDSHAAAVLACFPNAGVVELQVVVEPGGHVRSLRTPRTVTGAVTSCLDRALLGAQVSSPQPADLTLTHRFISAAASGTTATAPTTPPPSPPPAAAATNNPAAVAAGLDARAADIIACVGHSPLGVHATWDASGRVSVALVGELAGTAQERCVRAVVGAPHVAAGAGGDLVHVVRN